MKHHSELLTQEQLDHHSEYQQEANKFVGQTIKSVSVGKILGCVEVETDIGSFRVSGFDYPEGRDAGVFVTANRVLVQMGRISFLPARSRGDKGLRRVIGYQLVVNVFRKH